MDLIITVDAAPVVTPALPVQSDNDETTIVKTISLATLQQQVNARKAALGMLDTPAEVEAMRNKGANRTSAKRVCAVSRNGRVPLGSSL
jgi:hypothetical protein